MEVFFCKIAKNYLEYQNFLQDYSKCIAQDAPKNTGMQDTLWYSETKIQTFEYSKFVDGQISALSQCQNQKKKRLDAICF